MEKEREDNIIKLHDMMGMPGWGVYTSYLNGLLLKALGNGVFAEDMDTLREIKNKYVYKGVAQNLKRILTKKEEVDRLYKDLLKKREKEGKENARKKRI